MVDFGSGHVSRRSLQAETEGQSVFSTADIARYSEDCKKAKNAALGQKMLFMDGN